MLLFHLKYCRLLAVLAPPPSGRLGPIHDHRKSVIAADFMFIYKMILIQKCRTVFQTHTGEQCDVACGAEHFSCSNQCCIEKDLECDGEQQCSDGSDETECSRREDKHTHTHTLSSRYYLKE